MAIDKLKKLEIKAGRFHSFNLRNRDRLTEVFNSKYKKIFYMRFLLHSITEDLENIIFDSIYDSSKKGDIIALEFRTLEDENINKVYSNHYRRYINEVDILNKLENILFSDIILFKKSRGLSTYKDEDPFLARIIARRE